MIKYYISLICTITFLSCTSQTIPDYRISDSFGTYRSIVDSNRLDLVIGLSNDDLKVQTILSETNITEMSVSIDTTIGKVELYEFNPSDSPFRYSLQIISDGTILVGNKIEILTDAKEEVEFRKISPKYSFVSQNELPNDRVEVNKKPKQEKIERRTAPTQSRQVADVKSIDKSILYGSWNSTPNQNQGYTFRKDGTGIFRLNYSGGAGKCIFPFRYALSRNNNILTFNFDQQSISCKIRDAWGETTLDRNKENSIRDSYGRSQYKLTIRSNSLSFQDLSGLRIGSFTKQTGGLTDDGKLILN